jgi:hypothetical protein
MTIPASYAPDVYAGNGVTFSFPFTFKLLDAAHLVVQLTSGGVTTTLIKDVNYTLTWQGSGSTGTINRIRYVESVLTNFPLSNGDTLFISRDVTLSQDLDLRRGGHIGAESLERALDKIVMMVQEERHARQVIEGVLAGSLDDIESAPVTHEVLSGRATADQHPATSVTNTPAGQIGSTTVQGAINELDGRVIVLEGVAPAQQNTLAIAYSLIFGG